MCFYVEQFGTITDQCGGFQLAQGYLDNTTGYKLGIYIFTLQLRWADEESYLKVMSRNLVPLKTEALGFV